MNPQQAPRVVSKSRYLRYLGRKTTFLSSGMLQICFGAVGSCLSLAMLIATFSGYWNGHPQETVIDFLLRAAICLLLGGQFVWLMRSGVRQLNKIGQLERLAPLTRQTAEQLPAEQSLVRASAQPYEQQAVLLRAAGSDNHAPAQELLRTTTQEERHEA